MGAYGYAGVEALERHTTLIDDSCAVLSTAHCTLAYFSKPGGVMPPVRFGD